MFFFYWNVAYEKWDGNKNVYYDSNGDTLGYELNSEFYNANGKYLGNKEWHHGKMYYYMGSGSEKVEYAVEEYSFGVNEYYCTYQNNKYYLGDSKWDGNKTEFTRKCN